MGAKCAASFLKWHRQRGTRGGAIKVEGHKVIEAARRHLRCDKKLPRFLQEYGFTPKAPIKGQTKGKRAKAQ